MKVVDSRQSLVGDERAVGEAFLAGKEHRTVTEPSTPLAEPEELSFAGQGAPDSRHREEGPDEESARRDHVAAAFAGSGCDVCRMQWNQILGRSTLPASTRRRSSTRSHGSGPSEA